MKIEAGKKYRLIEESSFVPFGEIVKAHHQCRFMDSNYFFERDNGDVVAIHKSRVVQVEDMQPIAENLWQTLCYVKQALDSGAPIDKEYIAKVLAENRPEENSFNQTKQQ